MSDYVLNIIRLVLKTTGFVRNMSGFDFFVNQIAPAQPDFFFFFYLQRTKAIFSRQAANSIYWSVFQAVYAVESSPFLLQLFRP